MKFQTPEGFLRVVICPNCGNQIVATRPHMPPPTCYPREKIHYVFTPEPPYHAVFCTTCQHYTVFRAQDGKN
ncbi:MAG TPA: hypothetical protein VKF36_15825 [Syntrophorhabdales bacterium]|nr:hypothetical protein [Syntrophorhabdales bacterium]